MFLRASQVRPEDFQSVLLLAQSLQVLGKDETHEIARQGIVRARKLLKINPTDRRILSLTSTSLFDVGEQEEAIKWISKALELYPDDASVLINGACLFAKSGDKERSLSLLESAVRKGYGNGKWMERDPDFNSLRDEPRFKELLRLTGSEER